MRIDFVSTFQLVSDGYVDGLCELCVIFALGMLFVLYVNENSVDIFPHIFKSQESAIGKKNYDVDSKDLPFTMGSC